MGKMDGRGGGICNLAWHQERQALEERGGHRRALVQRLGNIDILTDCFMTEQ